MVAACHLLTRLMLKLRASGGPRNSWPFRSFARSKEDRSWTTVLGTEIPYIDSHNYFFQFSFSFSNCVKVSVFSHALDGLSF